MAFPLLGPLLGFAGTIGSSLIGSMGKQQTTNRVDYKAMVRDSEAAGFNPLTALRAGGAAGYTQTTHPALSAAGGIGAAFANLGQQITDYDPNAAANEALSRDLQRAQLENIQADTKQRMRSFDVRPSAGASVVGSPGGWSGTEPAAHKQLPGPWLNPPNQKQDALPIWVPGEDRDGAKIWIPNPEGPDLDQYAGAALMRSGAGYEAAAKTAIDIIREPAKQIRTKQVKQPDELGWGDYIPSLQWR